MVDVGVIHACGGAPEFHITSGLAVSGDRVLTRTLCTADVTDDWPPTRYEVFDYESRSLTAEFQMHDGQSGDLSPNGRYIAHQIQVRANGTSPPMTGAMVVTDIDTGATVTMDGLCAGNLELEIFDPTCGTSPGEPYVAWARDVHFSPDGRLVAMGTGAIAMTGYSCCLRQRRHPHSPPPRQPVRFASTPSTRLRCSTGPGSICHGRRNPT